MELNKECELCINCTRFGFYLGWFTNLNCTVKNGALVGHIKFNTLSV